MYKCVSDKQSRVTAVMIYAKHTFLVSFKYNCAMHISYMDY